MTEVKAPAEVPAPAKTENDDGKVAPEKVQSAAAKSRKPPEKRKIAVTRLAKARAATDIVTTLFCQRFLRNVTGILGVQFLGIFALLVTVILNDRAKKLMLDNWVLFLGVHSGCYLVIALSLIFFNKLYRKIGMTNYIPLGIVTFNIAGLLAIPVAHFKFWGIAAVTGAIGLYGVLMFIFQLLFRWELSLPSGLLGVIVGNAAFGGGAIAVLLHGFEVKSHAYLYFILEVVTVALWAYILYDLELMTSEPGRHKLLKYGIVYDSEAYGALHLCVDLVHGLLKIPVYFYSCCKPHVRKVWYRGFIPRSCFGCSLGKPYPKDGSNPDSDEEN